MTNNVAGFLAELSKDPDGMAAFSRDPELVLARAGLTDEDREALRSADPERIFQRLGLNESTYHLRLMGIKSNTPSPPPPPADPKPPEPPDPKPPKPRAK